MDSFIFKADTMRGLTTLALSTAELKTKINDTMKSAADNGEYWCHYVVPALCNENTVKDIKDALLRCGYRVKVQNLDSRFYVTILWAPEDRRVVCDGVEWNELEDYFERKQI